MTSLEGPIAGWALAKLGPLGRRLAQQMYRDHRPIIARRNSPASNYDSFYLFAAVAPSNTASPRSSLDFIDAANTFVRDGLSDMFTSNAEYSAAELVCDVIEHFS